MMTLIMACRKIGLAWADFLLALADQLISSARKMQYRYGHEPWECPGVPDCDGTLHV